MQKVISGVVLAATLTVTGCASLTSGQHYGAEGAGIGGAVGALVGNLVGGNTEATMIGGALGATVGGIIGTETEKELAKATAGTEIEVQRVSDSQVDLVMPSGLLFAVGSANLDDRVEGNLADVAQVQQKAPSNRLLVTGKTDSTGSAAVNQRLSEKRAKAVQSVLVDAGVASSEIQSIGVGESEALKAVGDNANAPEYRTVTISMVAVKEAQ